ncbi:hypothetical protein HDU84_007484 [Entophlyctis sp. JEL0112]|nr:hypothetical protein HDU84_007484 [Entophlyctis sp. JEL0112]
MLIFQPQIAQLKDRVQTAQGFPAAQQKLIYSGKILADDATVEGSGITEAGFIVVMVTKPKPASTSATPSVPAPEPVSAAAVVEAPPAVEPLTETVPAPAPVPPPTANEAATISATFDASTLATGDAYQRAVQNLIEMGFPADQVARAMKAAYNNPDRAAEYLMTGIPENVESMATPAPRSAAPPAASATPATGATPAPSAEDGYVNLFEAGAAAARDASSGNSTNPATDLDRITALANTPEFQQFRQLIHAQPHLLQPMLQQLGQSQPELLRVIQQNPDAFLQILGAGGAGVEAFGDYDEDEDSQMTGAREGGQTIQITAEENAAIERLTALGFDRNVAAQAYFACDKNEELAANYLFEVGHIYFYMLSFCINFNLQNVFQTRAQGTNRDKLDATEFKHMLRTAPVVPAQSPTPSISAAANSRTRKPVDYGGKTNLDPSLNADAPASANHPPPFGATDTTRSDGLEQSQEVRIHELTTPGQDTMAQSSQKLHVSHSLNNITSLASEPRTDAPPCNRSPYTGTAMRRTRAFGRDAAMEQSWKELYDDLYEKTCAADRDHARALAELRRANDSLEAQVLQLQQQLAVARASARPAAAANGPVDGGDDCERDTHDSATAREVQQLAAQIKHALHITVEHPTPAPKVTPAPAPLKPLKSANLAISHRVAEPALPDPTRAPPATAAVLPPESHPAVPNKRTEGNENTEVGLEAELLNLFNFSFAL